jgi:hypothetical protein
MFTSLSTCQSTDSIIEEDHGGMLKVYKQRVKHPVERMGLYVGLTRMNEVMNNIKKDLNMQGRSPIIRLKERVLYPSQRQEVLHPPL